MKEQGYYDRWIKPELGCNASVLAENKKGLFTSNTRYACRPVGNTPEGNPLDNSCFHDTRVSLGLNVAATWHLPDNDSRKFSMATPNQMYSAMMRIWDLENNVSPMSERIVHDVKGVPQAAIKIVEHGGAIKPGLANRNGHRAKKTDGRKKGVPKKKEVSMKTLQQLGIHHSIYTVLMEQYEKEQEQFYSSLVEKGSVLEGGIGYRFEKSS